jgi:PIN domain nuclease of toxin-antitoxin system
MEISIKHAIGKIRLDMSVRDLIDRILSQATIALPISTEHALAVGALPLHHRDPFDRALIAQAQIEDLTLVTADPRILRYDVPTIDARK